MTSRLLAVTAANHTATTPHSTGANAQSESAAPFSDVLSQANTLTKGHQTPQDTLKQTGSALAAKTDLKNPASRTGQNAAAGKDTARRRQRCAATIEPADSVRSSTATKTIGIA